MSDREAIRKKLQALLAKTTDRGATEEEALLATKKLSELLEKYNMTMSEVDIEQSEYDEIAVDVGKNKAHMASKLAPALGELTSTKVLQRRMSNAVQIVFFGSESDRQVAAYLLETIRNSMEYEYKQYKKTDQYKQNPYHGKTIRYSFMLGMALRIQDRIYEIIQHQQQNRDSTGTDLVVKKDQMVQDEFDKQHGKVKKQYQQQAPAKAYNALTEGYQAGDNVNLTTGIE